MSGTNPTSREIWAGSPVVYRGLIEDQASTYITQATISSMVYYVWDRGSTAPQTATSTGSLGSTNIYDALQTDGWDLDTTGYNFKAVFDGSNFPDADRKYRIGVWFDPTAGSTFPVVFEVKTKPVDGGS